MLVYFQFFSCESFPASFVPISFVRHQLEGRAAERTPSKFVGEKRVKEGGGGGGGGGGGEGGGRGWEGWGEGVGRAV